MTDTFEGTAWVFGDSVDTDNMYPGYAMRLSVEEAAQHIFYDLRPGWTEQVRPGDVVVAGKNFGIGSSRPVAALFQHLGVAALIAEEFNSLFLRNAINFGLPALTVPGVSELVRDGDRIRVDVSTATVEVIGRGERLTGVPLPEFVVEILARGGLMNKLISDGYITR